jgi:hypothetical protein
MHRRAPSPDYLPADLFTVVTTDIEVPHGLGSAHATCTVPRDLDLIMIGPHAHEWGTRVQVQRTPAAGRGSEMLVDANWDRARVLDPPLTWYQKDAPLHLAPGDTVSVDCDYMNDTTEPLEFPREMCVGFGFYYPADRELDCVDGAFPE